VNRKLKERSLPLYLLQLLFLLIFFYEKVKFLRKHRCVGYECNRVPMFVTAELQTTVYTSHMHVFMNNVYLHTKFHISLYRSISHRHETKK
jgi:hypothetical protein